MGVQSTSTPSGFRRFGWIVKPKTTNYDDSDEARGRSKMHWCTSRNCSMFAKVATVLSSIFLLTFAGLLMALSVMVLVQLVNYDSVFAERARIAPAIALILIAALLAFCALTLFFTVVKPKPWLLIALACVLTALILIVTGAFVAVMTKKQILDAEIESVMVKAMESYDSDMRVREEIDSIQEKLNCCGASNYNDWRETSYWVKADAYPASCCNVTMGVCDGHSMTADKQHLLYQIGCYDEISEILRANSKAIFWAIVATLIVLVLELIATLARYMQRAYAGDEEDETKPITTYRHDLRDD